MAAYAASVTLQGRGPKRIGAGLAIMAGKVNVTNYNSTRTEITGITKKFKGGNPIVILDAASDEGYVLKWDYTDKAVKAYRPAGTVSKPTLTITKGAILASSELGLSADSAAATVNNNTIAATLALTAPVSQPTFSGAASAEVASDVDVGEVGFIAIGPI